MNHFILVAKPTSIALTSIITFLITIIILALFGAIIYIYLITIKLRADLVALQQKQTKEFAPSNEIEISMKITSTSSIKISISPAIASTSSDTIYLTFMMLLKENDSLTLSMKYITGETTLIVHSLNLQN